MASTILNGQAEKLHPWTDAQGRTLQASFISFDGTKVTIKWDGQVVPIPLASLSPESQNLAKQLGAKMSVSPPTLDKNKLHSWTDIQGRTLEARFVQTFCGYSNNRMERPNGSSTDEQFVSSVASPCQSTCFRRYHNSQPSTFDSRCPHPQNQKLRRLNLPWLPRTWP